MDTAASLQFGFGRKLPVILQTEASECGLSCLAMVASFHGYRIDLASLRERYSVSLKGMHLAQVIDVASMMGLNCRPLRAELEALADLKMPAVLHWNFNHYVVLQGLKAGRVTIHDPATGVQHLPLSEASKHFTGVALELEPSVQFQEKTEKRAIRLSSLTGKVRGLNASLLQVLALALTLEVFSLVTPFLTQWIMDDALVSGDRDLLTVVALGILMLGVLRVAVGVVRSWVLLHMSTHLNVQWVANLMDHLLRLPLPFFEKRHMGDVVSRFGAVSAIQQTLTVGFIAAVLDGMLAIATLTMMMVYSMVMGTIALGATFLYGIVRWAKYGALHVASEGQIVRAAKQQTYFMESVRCIQAIKLFNREADRKAKYVNSTVELANNNVEIQKLNILFQAASGLLISVEAVVILWLGSHSVIDGKFTIGMLIAFIAYKDQFASRVNSLIDKSVEFRMLRIQTERLSDIVLTAPEQVAPPTLVPTGIENGIELRNVRFRYASGEPWVIDGVSLTVGAGESVVLVGPSGCGKTTLVKIMLGLLEPVEGEVLIGGTPLRQVGLKNYRNLVGTVMQNDVLFAGSLADNISFFDPIADQEQIEVCAKLARIHDVIAGMPMGYHTLVGDMGSVLSGGQTQRLLLARALYKRPRILFLDEATSHLDVALDHQIATAIGHLAMTRVVVAHRPETIQMSGRVIHFSPALPRDRSLLQEDS